jgi:two-component system chemotaxis response regulator CheB
MGASAGGIEALSWILSEFPPDLAVKVGVVLHRAPFATELLQVLGKRSALSIVEPSVDTVLRRGVIYLAPPDHHLEFVRNRVTVRRGPREHSARPAVDPLFRSASESFGERVVGVLLSGGGEDGVNGLMVIKGNGGISLVQEPGDAVIPFMPMNAIRYDHVDCVLPLKSMANALVALVRGHVLEC